MGLQQSKDELVFQQVNYGNIEGIKSLRAEGAGLEWIDKEGKTPLILACMNPGLYNVAKTLIELGANVNAYRPGLHAGTPLHHAAKRGNEHVVKLLLSHGANALVMNDSCQTALDVARLKGYSNVVRTIESHICLFAGWLQELYGPGFLELLAPQLLSRKVWAVVLPCGSRKPSKPFKLELAIYSSSQDAQPRTTIALWKANMDDTNLYRPDPAVIITCSNKSRIKLSSINASERQQLERFCNACKGIPQAVVPAFPFNTQGSIIEATAPPVAEDVELAFAISASLHSVAQERPMDVNHSPGSNASCSYTDSTSHNVSNNRSNCEIQEVGSSSNPIQHDETNSNTNSVDGSNISSIVSAPPISDMITDEGPIHYPSIDSSQVDLSLCSAVVEDNLPAKNYEKNDDNVDSSSCVICLDAPIEGACVPCGHMAGCMSCLNEIKAKKWGCPVCRSKIDQVIRVYAV